MLLEEHLEPDIQEDTLEGVVAAVRARLIDKRRGDVNVEVTVGHASLPHARILDDR